MSVLADTSEIEELPDFEPMAEDVDPQAVSDAWMDRARAAEEALRQMIEDESSTRITVRRSSDQFIQSLCQLTEETLAELRHIRAALGSSSDSRSSVEIKTSTRGVDISSKAYEGSSTDGLVDLAVSNYFEAISKVQARVDVGTGK